MAGEQGRKRTAPSTSTPGQQQPLKQKASLCDECQTNPSKYKCPGCSLRTCSLPCVSSHKLRTRCAGKRDLSHSIPLSQFDDNLLISDFNLLEDVKRVAESARRVRVQVCGYPHFKLPFRLKGLKNAAAIRGTKLLLLPRGMSKREKNQTRFDRRDKFISWTIEWRFHSTDIVLLDHRVHENTKMRSIIEKHLEPSPWNHKLRKFCEERLEHLRFFICKYPHKGPKSPFHEVGINASVKELLANLVVLEYPVIHVFLPSHKCDFEIVRVVNPQPVKREHESDQEDDFPSPRGVLFKEEEIEDESSPDPKVVDLLESSGTDAAMQSAHHYRQPGEQSSANAANKLPVANNLPGSSSGSHQAVDDSFPSIDDLDDFDFDQDLIDAYSYIIAQSDGFLDFEGEVDAAGVDLIQAGDFASVDEELEEGEIPSFE